MNKEKENLKKAIDKLDKNIQGNVDKEGRTEESKKAYDEAIRKAALVKDDAENVMTKPNVTEKELKDEIKKVEEVDNALTKAKDELEYDKSELKVLSKNYMMQLHKYLI